MNSELIAPAALSRILVVDDHAMMRDGLVELIRHQPDLMVCGEAGEAAGALELIVKTKPDLILLDLSLPGVSGVDVIKEMRTLHSSAVILVISMHDENMYAERALRAGASGYIMKQEGGQRLMEAIRKVLSGKVFVSDKIASKILDLYSGKTADVSPLDRLTDRELQVFQLIGSGKTTRAIAVDLQLSPKTIEVHRARIKEKLSIETGAALISFAARWNEKAS